jgi:hypothetical protein
VDTDPILCARIKVEYGEEVNEGEYRGTFRTVSDREHAEMIRLHIEEGLSYEKIATQFNRPSRTPLLHIQRHNRAVEGNGFCSICRRIKSDYENRIIKKVEKPIHLDVRASPGDHT